jgi:hypothetical protein
MSRLLFSSGARGQAVEDIQTSLRFDARDIDGSYGNQTHTAVAAFQGPRGLPQTGQVDDLTWNQLLQRPIPHIFERCLALTAAFEGHGFSLAQGNFDGAGITWGIIGFTLKHGELTKIVLAIQNSRPDLVRLAFEDNTARLLEVLQAPLADQLAFANGVSIGTKKVRLAEPWRSAFDLFGKLPEVRAEQLRLAREDFFDPAVKTATKFGLATELGFALAFDIHVQNGGIKKAAADQIRSVPTPSDEVDLRRLIADAVADAASSSFREDVRARKRAVAEGAGTVHGEVFNLPNWGIADLPAELT